MLQGPASVGEALNLGMLRERLPVVVLVAMARGTRVEKNLPPQSN
jgi:hypothetical protein